MTVSGIKPLFRTIFHADLLQQRAEAILGHLGVEIEAGSAVPALQVVLQPLAEKDKLLQTYLNLPKLQIEALRKLVAGERERALPLLNNLERDSSRGLRFVLEIAYEVQKGESLAEKLQKAAEKVTHP